MIEQMNEFVEIDICGQICPSSLLTALREVNKHKDSLRKDKLKLYILTDNHDSTNRICHAVSNMGYRIDVEDTGEYFKILIEK